MKVVTLAVSVLSFIGAVFMPKNAGSIEVERHLNDLFINEMTMDHEGYLWCSEYIVGPYPQHVVRFNPKDKTHTVYAEGLPSASPLLLTVDARGGVWCASQGLSKFDGSQWTLFPYENEFGSNAGEISAIAALPSGGIVLSCCKSTVDPLTYQVSLSMYNGKSWNILTPPGQFDNDVISSIAVAPNGEIWCGTASWASGIYRYTGNSWIHYSTDHKLTFNNVNVIAADAQSAIWCFRVDGVSRFDGKEWTDYTEGFPGRDIHAISLGPDNTVWYGTYNHGLVCFDGHTWKQYTTEDGLPSNMVNCVYAGQGEPVYIGTDKGIAIIRGDQTSVGESHAPHPVAGRLNIYPNPFNSCTTISYILHAAGRAGLSVYNINGQKVCNLASGYHSAGTHSTVWDGRDDSGNFVSSGVYIIRLESGGKVNSAKMLFMK